MTRKMGRCVTKKMGTHIGTSFTAKKHRNRASTLAETGATEWVVAERCYLYGHSVGNKRCS